MISARCFNCDAEILVCATPRNGRVLLRPTPGKPSSGGTHVVRDGLAYRVVATAKEAAANDRRVLESACAGLPRYFEHDTECTTAARALADAEQHGAASAQRKQRKT